MSSFGVLQRGRIRQKRGLIAPLENRFERPAQPPENASAIIMLGGATAGRVSTARQIAELTEAGDRLAETVRLASVYPVAKIIVSGGVGLLIADGEPEASTALRFFTDQGIARERIVLESESRNTNENAAFTARSVGEYPGQVLLVTSAFHMPRSVGLFRNVEVDVVPWLVDYCSAGSEGVGSTANPVLNITTTGVAIRSG
jgi:uncharacterized SAM-binding protein YcdF (DUF218 family)